MIGSITASAAEASPAPRGVTLITGDEVLVDQAGRVRGVHPGPNRKHVLFHHYTQKNHTYVIPFDAERLVRNDKLDRRLFDVAELLRSGYQRQTPLLVNGKQVHANWEVLSQSTEKIWLDARYQLSLDRSVPQVGAPQAWRAGYTGKGVKVAVLDSGVDQNHPDLKGRQAAEKNFTREPDNTDHVGHGTHVAATIASNDAGFRGVAPDAQILDGKVCERQGCQLSAILDGMRWAVEQGASVVNLSLGGTDEAGVDPLEEAVNTLSAQHGVLFVIAAGNEGRAESIGSPGSADAALTVGAVDKEDVLAPFSSRGPRAGDGAIKPDVTAPGVAITAAKANSTGRVAFDGTSMATPHVAGAAAVLKQQHPDWNGTQLKAALTSSAKRLEGRSPMEQGAGRIDLAEAITAQVTAEPSNLHMGLAQWPHNDDPLVTRQLTYRNTSTESVTFDLEIDSAAPAGMFKLGAEKITVPARGEARVAITADTRVGATDGTFTGAVMATAGTRTVRSLLSVNREVESYTLSVSHIDRQGKPAPNYLTTVLGVENDKLVSPYDESGTFTARLPKGHYVVDGLVEVPGQMDQMVHPGVHLTEDVAVTLDARLTKPISVKAPERLSEHLESDIFWEREEGDAVTGGGFFGIGDFSGIMQTAHVGPALTGTRFAAKVGQQAVAEKANTMYRFAWELPGVYPTGFARAPEKNELARVETRYGKGNADREILRGNFSRGQLVVTGITGLFSTEDARSTEYLTTDVSWSPTLDVRRPDGESDLFVFMGPDRRYRPGRTYTERAGFGVFSPTASGVAELPQLARFGDTIGIQPSLFGDNTGGRAEIREKSGRTALFRDGVKVGEAATGYAAEFKVPAAAANYRIETEQTREAEVSTEVKAAWTFRSQRRDERQTPLPLTAVRFPVRLDDDNSLPAGRVQRLPIEVQQQAGADNGRVRSVKVEVSFDDGRTWRAVPVSANCALVRHPKTAGFVSLRVKAADSKGNTAEHTVIRAYRLK
ncbi:S8 family serine peptidase [Lentzea tibetensis]|uniref:S8 family serine peptidase n=1 Tax=Lentzea tibetensis TaxID=2591470 RepID=UPI0016440805|nr:S8 family serine peptidase [Lentzea tibetensis]